MSGVVLRAWATRAMNDWYSWSTLRWIMSARRGSSGTRGSKALRSQVVASVVEWTPSLSRVPEKLGNSAITPIEPVTVLGSAMISSDAVAIQ